jgi:1,4-alpha-glucan branching enzyme
MLSWEYPPNVMGGLGRHVAELSPALVQQGVELHVVTPTVKKQDIPIVRDHGVVVHWVFTPTIGVESLDIYARATIINKALADYALLLPQIYGSYDLIHVHDWLTGFAGITLQQNWGCPLVVTIHATEQGRSRGHLNNQLQFAIDGAERELIRSASSIIVCSEFMSREMKNLFQVPADKLQVIPNAVNIETMPDGHTPGDIAAFRTKYADPGDLIVFTISRLVYEKGVHRLVQAAPRILAECPQARILIAGRGPEAEYLQQQARDLGVAERVNFIGFISDDDRNLIFGSAACAVFPSLYEPFGIVALEAMAFNCPVVVSQVGGFAEIVKHTETGVTVYPDDAGSIAWGVLHILQHQDLARGYAIKARQTIDLVFNWPRVAQLTELVYRHVLAKPADAVEL